MTDRRSYRAWTTWLWFFVLVGSILWYGHAAAGPSSTQGGDDPSDQPDVSFSQQFDGGRMGKCIYHDGQFQLWIEAEDDPINDSAWYAFQVRSARPRRITIQLLYPQGTHRYWPKVSRDGRRWEPIAAERYQAGRREARLDLDVGPRPVWVAAQELIGSSQIQQWMATLAEHEFVRRGTIGRSVQGRSLAKLAIGNADAGRHVVIVARQHPPEVTGSSGMMTMVESLCADSPLARSFRQQFCTSVVPMANPDGVTMGNWRHNAQGVDLNRDWGTFSQPETRAMRDELLRLDKRGDVYLFLDFHSTYHDVFYTHADSAAIFPADFTRLWLASVQRRLASYPLRRDICHSNQGTARQWVGSMLSAPAITYEVGDATPRDQIQRLARVCAEELMRGLLQYAEAASPATVADQPGRAKKALASSST